MLLLIFLKSKIAYAPPIQAINIIHQANERFFLVNNEIYMPIREGVQLNDASFDNSEDQNQMFPSEQVIV